MTAEFDLFPPPHRTIHHTRNAATALGLVGAAAAAGSIASDPDDRWYTDLDKPAWQPPPEVFPAVWSTLYATIAADSAAVLNELDRQGDKEGAAAFRAALARNMALNGAWSWLFFRNRNLLASAIGAGLLAVNSICLARRAARAGRRFGLVMAPYAAWTSFATVLATEVWRRNRNS